jgi:FkbM family methyltransferase
MEVMLSALYHVLVKESDVVIDIGANGGLHTIPLAKKVGSKGLVYAFEPQKIPRESLTEWLKYENLLHNVKIYNCAIGNENTMVNFYINHLDPGLSTLKLNSQHDLKVSEKIKVKLLKLDTLLSNEENLNSLTFIKIDIEGGERDAIFGAKETIKKFNPVIVFENGFEWSAIRYGYYSYDIINFFEENDYELYDFFGTQISKDFFSDKYLIHMLIAFPKKYPQKNTILKMLHDYKNNLKNISLPQEWVKVMELVGDPLKNNFFNQLIVHHSF